MKRGQVSIFIIIALLLVLGIILIGVFNLEKKPKPKIYECEADAECVKATCCHATSCVPKKDEPECSGILCTAVCEPGTLDCDQGSCSCVGNKCKAVLNR